MRECVSVCPCQVSHLPLLHRLRLRQETVHFGDAVEAGLSLLSCRHAAALAGGKVCSSVDVLLVDVDVVICPCSAMSGHHEEAEEELRDKHESLEVVVASSPSRLRSPSICLPSRWGCREQQDSPRLVLYSFVRAWKEGEDRLVC